MHTKKLILLFIFLAGSWLSSCQNAPVPTATSVPKLTSTLLAATIPSATSTTIPSPEATLPPTTTIPSPQPSKTDTTPSAASACVNIYYEGNAQVEILTDQGERVLVDVYDPKQLSTPSTAEDVLLTTHTHWDHINDPFLTKFSGPQLFIQTGEISLPWVHIQGIASAHNAGDELKPKNGTNYIYLLEIGGLRLAHFGDIGQDTFTDEQLAMLQPLDIAIIQIANSYSDMSATNQKGIKLIAQLAPRLVIPTHADLDSAKVAVAQWPGLYSDKPTVHLCSDQIPTQTQILFLGEWATRFPKYINLTQVDW